jgi:hypothetical protein
MILSPALPFKMGATIGTQLRCAKRRGVMRPRRVTRPDNRISFHGNRFFKVSKGDLISIIFQTTSFLWQTLMPIRRAAVVRCGLH